MQCSDTAVVQLLLGSEASRLLHNNAPSGRLAAALGGQTCRPLPGRAMTSCWKRSTSTGSRGKFPQNDSHGAAGMGLVGGPLPPTQTQP